MVREATEDLMEIAMPAAAIGSAIGSAIAYAIGQPAEVDVSEIVVRPTARG
ncbi:hypothetical protein ABCR94_16385 [Streptomyces sp. 21So2-11]|uniref:hypothetical protein n=1 Tax=Streptomyces sp. 21So2-11 TaxID=3144408 RepID=UPI00321C1E01